MVRKLSKSWQKVVKKVVKKFKIQQTVVGGGEIVVPKDFGISFADRPKAKRHHQKQVGAPTVPSAVIRGSNEFKDFRYHRGLLKYGRKKCHIVVRKIV
jgi:hypothetical protein